MLEDKITGFRGRIVLTPNGHASKQLHSTSGNIRLSRQRAKVAEDYIKARISNPDRATSRGYVESQWMNKCLDGSRCSEEEHQENRITEFIILEL